MKICTKCHLERPETDFQKKGGTRSGLQSWCKPCMKICKQASYKLDTPEQRARRTSWSQRNPELRKSYARRAHLLRSFGLTQENFEQMIKDQNGTCASCKDPNPGNTHNQWHIDHCHTTGKVRGLLCTGCNNGSGLPDNPDKLLKKIIYLARHGVFLTNPGLVLEVSHVLRSPHRLAHSVSVDSVGGM